VSDTPGELKYAQTHEWARLEEDNTVTVGITAHAQDALGDVVFVELPEPGRSFTAGQEAGVVESVKAASDIYAPVAGEVLEVNELLVENPQLINEDPYGEGWMFRLQAMEVTELDQLLTAEAYQQLCDDS
jgi:glycine cleavage system H protein